MPWRHGLRTMALGERGDDRQALTKQVLARGSPVLTRILPEPGDGQQVETVGERLLLLDETGRAAAVIEVDAVQPTTVGELSNAPVTPAVTFDGPSRSALTPTSAQAAGVSTAELSPKMPAVRLVVHVVGHFGTRRQPVKGEAATAAS